MNRTMGSWSCDSLAVQARYTSYAATVLGKNSDRPAGETQPLRWLDSRRGSGPLRLAYVEVDNVTETIPHLGSSPYWCWGHEIGLNVHGVAIGNEALFTRDLALASAAYRSGEELAPGILGMELLRLGLERGETAGRAIEVMTDLVERYGQWGAGTVSHDRADAAYDNSYLIADPREVWALETSGRGWAAKKIDAPAWSLSNEPTIRTDWTRCSTGLEEYARERGWWQQPGRLDFAEAFTDPGTPLQISHIRLQRSRQMLGDAVKAGPVTFDDVRAVLADHYEGTFLDGPNFNAARPDFLTLCMHDHPSGFTWGNTAASAIAVLPTQGCPYLWWAATTPCTSLYIPVTLGGGVPEVLSRAGSHTATTPNPEEAEKDTYAESSYWWTFQRLLETVAGDDLGTRYNDRQPVVRQRFDRLQAQWLHAVDDLTQTNAPEQAWAKLTSRCVTEAKTTAQDLIRELQDHQERR
jgi:secernin